MSPSVPERVLWWVQSTVRSSGVLAAVLAASCLPTYAQTNWTGATSTNWFTATNWNTGVVPTAGDNVNLNTITTNPTLISGGAAVGNILAVGSSAIGALTIQNSGTLN